MQNKYLKIKGETGSLFLLSTEKTPSECPESCPFFQKGNNVSLECFQLKLGAPPGVPFSIHKKADMLFRRFTKSRILSFMWQNLFRYKENDLCLRATFVGWKTCPLIFILVMIDLPEKKFGDLDFGFRVPGFMFRIIVFITHIGSATLSGTPNSKEN